MNIIIKIEKEDIETTRLGENINVKIADAMSLVFTFDAVEELYNDSLLLLKKKGSRNKTMPNIEKPVFPPDKIEKR